MNSIKELWHDLDYSWLVDKNLRHADKGEVIIKSIYSLISIGTERTVTTHLLQEQVAEKMRIPYMKGDFQNEFTYGYSLIGKVVEGPEKMVGDLVHVMHPHQDHAIVKSEDIYVLPEGISLKLATLASNMETAVNAIWDAQIEIGDKVLIIGYGTVGALTALIINGIPGADISILEVNENRINAAIEHGYSVNSTLGNSVFDVVFNTSGNADMLQKAISLTKREGKIVEMSWYGSKSIEINLGADFHYGRKQIISSQVSQIPNRKISNWTYRTRKNLVFKLLKELNPHFLIDNEISFSDTPTFYDDLRKGNTNGLGVIIKY